MEVKDVKNPIVKPHSFYLSNFFTNMSSLEHDKNDAKEAMKKAQTEYNEAKDRFTEEWKENNGSKLTVAYDREMKAALKEEYENLKDARKLYNDLLNQSLLVKGGNERLNVSYCCRNILESIRLRDELSFS